jgi:pimeloyl-ACP methyl ester carboxylesterase
MDAAGTWDLVVPSLVAAGLRVVAPDLRGFGKGARVPADGYYYFTDYVKDVAAYVREIVPAGEKIFLVGHSMGGTVASYYTGAFPERVAKLALLEGVGPSDNPHNVAPLRMRRWIDQVAEARRSERGERGEPKVIPSHEAALRRLAVNSPGVDIEVLRSRLPYLLATAEDGTLTWAADPLHRTVSPIPFYVAAYKEFAKAITCPVLFVSGGPEGFHPEQEDDRLSAFASLTRVDMPKAGHAMHWTAPEELGAHLVRFWQS